MQTIREIFTANLIRLRGKRTQDEVAEAAGIPLRSYQNVEINGAIPQGPNLSAIAKAFGVPESHLFVDPSEFIPADTSIDSLKLRCISALATCNNRERLDRVLIALGADAETSRAVDALLEAEEPLEKLE